MAEKREDHKAWEFGGRQWDIGKFDARTGSYLAFKLMSDFGPMLSGGVHAAMSGQSADKAFEAVFKKGVPSMSRADFDEIQTECLRVCRELTKSGPVDVLDERGNFGVNDLEYDAKTVMALTIQALVFNVSSFFDAGLLDSLAGILGMSPPAAKTSTSS